jgi:hypothetical protein
LPDGRFSVSIYLRATFCAVVSLCAGKAHMLQLERFSLPTIAPLISIHKDEKYRHFNDTPA